MQRESGTAGPARGRMFPVIRPWLQHLPAPQNRDRSTILRIDPYTRPPIPHEDYNSKGIWCQCPTFDTPVSGMMAAAPQEVMMANANVLLARCALPSGPAWGVLADDRIEIVATDAGTNGGFLASLLQLPRPVRSLLERRRGAQSLKAAEVMAAPSSGVAPHLLPPLDLQEVWAAGVTYERSRVARMEETAGAPTLYDKGHRAP